jgi:hypothetical protein
MVVSKQDGLGARVNVKLAPEVDPGEADLILRDTPGFRSAVQLFPEETDREMLGMYLLEVDSASLDEAIQRLTKNREIEFAHRTAPRRLIR